MVSWRDIVAADLDLGFKSWRIVTSGQAESFAWAIRAPRLTNVGPASAVAARPPRETTVDGYLLLPMMPALLAERIAAPDGAAVMNYGLNALRFSAPVGVGAKVRRRFVLTGRNRIEASRMILKIRSTIVVEGGSAPAVLADPKIAHVRFLPAMDVRRAEAKDARKT